MAQIEMLVYDQKPNLLLGRAFQQPDRSVIIEDGEIDFYDQKPNLLFGRAFQQPDETIVIRRSRCL